MNFRRVVSTTALISIGLVWTTSTNCLAQTKASQIAALMSSLSERGQFNGSILVAEQGRMIYERGFGTSDVKHNAAFSPNTPVYLASLTKQFTALAIIMLAERNQLSYRDPLSKYFPEFPSYAERITIRNLLNHTSGIPDYVELGLERPGLTNKDVLSTLIRQPAPGFAPGDKFEYSNSNYVLLALIIEKVSGQPYSLFLRQKIFVPLGMKHTFVYDQSRQKMSRAIGYNRFGDVSDYDLLTYGEGGIYSTVADLFKWDLALYTEKLVRHATLDEAFTRGNLNDGSSTSYGFGWAIAEYNGETIYAHAGRYGGFNTYIKRFPKERATIIFLTNHDFRNMGAIGNALINILHDESYTLPKLSVAELLYRTYRTQGVAATVQRYRSLKQSADPTDDFSESELNELGYELLGKNQTQDAIEILKLNVEEFPLSWNVYDGLGEAFMKNGNKELAIENYKKSLELNPKNSNAQAMLKKLTGQPRDQ
ncbi:MAG TPA: serine hydrolase [Blastocatellia bacterium]|nr:serine hydrolase [Blastocatellia bacterium]